MNVIWSNFAVKMLKEINHYYKEKVSVRYLVIWNYKIIYKPVKEGVLITDVFNTRQNPNKNNNQPR